MAGTQRTRRCRRAHHSVFSMRGRDATGCDYKLTPDVAVFPMRGRDAKRPGFFPQPSRCGLQTPPAQSHPIREDGPAAGNAPPASIAGKERSAGRSKPKRPAGQKISPRQSRECGQSPMLLAHASRRASTVCQPRELCYLSPANAFRKFSSSVVLLLYPRPTDDECIPQSSSHSFPLCLIIPSAPKFPLPVLMRQFWGLLLNHQAAFLKARYCHFRRYLH